MRTAAGPTLLLAQGRLEEGLPRLVHCKHNVSEPRRHAKVRLTPPLDHADDRVEEPLVVEEGDGDGGAHHHGLLHRRPQPERLTRRRAEGLKPGLAPRPRHLHRLRVARLYQLHEQCPAVRQQRDVAALRQQAPVLARVGREDDWPVRSRLRHVLRPHDVTQPVQIQTLHLRGRLPQQVGRKAVVAHRQPLTHFA